MFLLFIILIVVIICLARSNRDLSDENFKLKNDLKNVNNFCPNCGYELNKVQILKKPLVQQQGDFNQSSEMTNVLLEVPSVSKKEKFTNKEMKNSLILITGSILIVLSALVFLTSTWNITHNFLKTMIIVLMFGVFLVASHLADKIFKLKQTSRAFYYITLAYLPILLLSIALFQLFGKYLSLYGLGRYIYLAVSTFLVAIVYYYNSISKKSNILSIFSIIFLMLSIVFGTLIFINSFIVNLVVLILFDLVMIICYLYNKNYYSRNFHFKFIMVFTPVLGVVLLNYQFVSFFDSVTVMNVIAEILLFVSVYLLLVKIWVKESFYHYIYPIFTVVVFYTLSRVLGDNFIIRQLFLLLSFAVIYLYDFIKVTKIRLTSFFEIMGVFLLLYIVTLIKVNVFGILGLDSYMLWIVFTTLSIFSYLLSDKVKLLQAYFLTLSIIFTVLHIVISSQLSVALIGYMLLGLIICSNVLPKIDNYLKNAFFMVGHISFWIITFFNMHIVDFSLLFVLLYITYTFSTFLESIKNRRQYLKVISYIYLNLSVYYLFRFLGTDMNVCILPFTTFIIVCLDIIREKGQNKVNEIYIMIQFVLAFLLLVSDFSILNFSLVIILGIVHIFYTMYGEKNRNYLYIPSLSIIPYVYISDLLILGAVNYMYLVSIMLVASILCLVYYKKNNMYISLFYIYMFYHVICLEEVKYISILILMVGTFIICFIKENKVKDLFRVLLYIFSFVFYQFIIFDLGLDGVTFLLIGNYLILLLFITRRIISKYNNSYKVLEYIFCVLVNLIALGCYTSEFDGILYVLFLAGIVIVSYIYKYGPFFLISLIFILLNVFILTRTFWFSIPWWIYILLIGSILISFAIYNELKLKKENDFKDKVKDFKKYLDL